MVPRSLHSSGIQNPLELRFAVTAHDSFDVPGARTSAQPRSCTTSTEACILRPVVTATAAAGLLVEVT